jgi:hypothetical protein
MLCQLRARIGLAYPSGARQRHRPDDVVPERLFPGHLLRVCVKAGRKRIPIAPVEIRAQEQGNGSLSSAWMKASFEMREPVDHPWRCRQPKYERLVRLAPDGFRLVTKLPFGDPITGAAWKEATGRRPVAGSPLRARVRELRR